METNELFDKNYVKGRWFSGRGWNVQGVSKKLTEMPSEIENHRVDLAEITETPGSRSENLGSYDMFYSGVSKDQRAQQGVAILVRKELRRCMSSWEAIDQRIVKMNLTLHGHKTTILEVYGVNDNAPVGTKTLLFEQLNDTFLKVGTTREVISMVTKVFNSVCGIPHSLSLVAYNHLSSADLWPAFKVDLLR